MSDAVERRFFCVKKTNKISIWEQIQRAKWIKPDKSRFKGGLRALGGATVEMDHVY